MVLDMLTAAQGGTCAIIKVQCCVYIPDLSGSVSAALDAMKSHVKAMWNENIPFWTLVLSWVKGDWWKTIFIIVTVVLIVLLCGPCILQCNMNFVTKGWCRSPRLAVGEPGAIYPYEWCSYYELRASREGNKKKKRERRMKEEIEQALSWKRGSILGQTVDFELYAQYLWKLHTNLKTRPPGGRASRVSIA